MSVRKKPSKQINHSKLKSVRQKLEFVSDSEEEDFGKRFQAAISKINEISLPKFV